MLSSLRLQQNRSIVFDTSRHGSWTSTQPTRKRTVRTCSIALRSRTICQVRADAGSAQSTAVAKTVLYVTQLDASIKGDELATLFKSQPGFDSAFVMNVDDEGGQQQYMGYVQFESPQAAAAAQKALDGSELRQKRIRVRTQHSSSQGDDDDTSPAAANTEELSASAEPPEGSSPPSPDSPSSELDSSSSAPSSPVTSDSTASDGEQPNPMSRSAKYRQRQNAKKQQPPPPPSPNVLFVPNMKTGTTDEQLAQAFREQPGYQSASVRLFSGRRHDGYVEFDAASSAAAAMEAVNGTSLNGKPLKVFVHSGYDKEAAAAKSAANAAKSQAKQQEEGSSEKSEPGTTTDSSGGSTQPDQGKQKQRQRQRRGVVTYSLKVQGLAWATTAEGLSQHFSDCQGFLNAATTLNQEGRASGIGYVKFDSADAAQAALQAKDETELEGRTIKVMITAREAAKFATAAAKADSSSSGSSGGRPGGSAAWALQVFNLAWEVTDADLAEHFKECRGVTGSFIVTGQDNRPSGQGYVTFDSQAAQLEALKSKQNTELVGRSVSLRTTRPGRVEGGAAAGASEAAETAELVLMGLPSSFTYREALGLCSYFGDVKQVVRMRKGSPAKPDAGSSSGGSDSGGQDSANAADAGAAGGADARAGQPCFVHMESAGAAAAAVRGLNGRMIQGCKVTAAFAKPKTARKKKKEAPAGAEAASSEQ